MACDLLDGDFDSYRRHVAMSQSDIKMFRRSRREFDLRKVQGVPGPPPTPSMEFGKRVEMALLGGLDGLTGRIHMVPSAMLDKAGRLSTKAAKEEVAAAKSAGKIPMKEPEFDAFLEPFRLILEHVRDHENANFITLEPLGDARRWHTKVVWDHGLYPLQLKAEIDIILEHPDGRVFLVDVKTAADVTERGFRRAIEKFGYDIQAAMYCEAFSQLTGGDVPAAYLFVAIHNAWPYEVAVYSMPHDWIERGQMIIDDTLPQIVDCLAGLPDSLKAEHGGQIKHLTIPNFLKNTEISL